MGLFDFIKKATDFVQEQTKNLEQQFDQLKDGVTNFVEEQRAKEEGREIEKNIAKNNTEETKSTAKTEQNTNTSTHSQILNGDDFSFTTSKGETVSNSSKIMDRRMGNLYVDVVALPQKDDKQYLRMQDVKFVGGVDIAEVIVIHIPLSEISTSYLSIDTNYSIIKLQAKQHKQVFKPAGLEDKGEFFGEIMLFYANKEEFTTFVTEKLLPNFENKLVKNEFCKAFDIQLESDFVVDNSPRVFQSFGDNQLKSEGLPHDSTLDVYNNYQNSYKENYYLLQENYLQVEEYFYIRDNNYSPYNLYSASKIIFYYEDMRGLEYSYDGHLTINGKTQKCYFEYEYKSNFYTLSQSSNGWLLLVTTPKFDIKGLEEKLKQKIEESAMVLLLDNEKLPNMTEKIVFSAQHPQGISEKLYGMPSTENLVLVESDDEKTADIRDVLFGTNKGTYDALFEIVGNKIYKGEVAEENLILVNLTHNWLDEDLTGSVIQKVQNGQILKFSNVKHQNETITYNTISEGWLDIYTQEIHKGRNKNHLESMASGGLMIHECNVHKSDTYSGNCLVTFNGMVNEENQLFIMEVLNESLYYQYAYKYPMSELKDVYESGTPIIKQQQEENRNEVTNSTSNSTKKETKKEEKPSNNSSSNAKAKNIAIKVKNDTGDEMNVYNQGSGGNYRLQKNIITTIKMDEDDKLYEYNNAKKGRLLLTASPDMDGKTFLISKL